MKSRDDPDSLKNIMIELKQKNKDLSYKERLEQASIIRNDRLREKKNE